MASLKRSFYGRVRSTAYDLWRGPCYVNNHDENNPLSGLCILRLAMRRGTSTQPVIEARAVYGSFAHEAQDDTILRAIYWDSKTVIRDAAQENSQIKIPARFVQVPVSQVQQWIRSLDGLQTAIQANSHEDDGLPICSLRVEANPVYALFEKTWQVVEGENTELNRVWQEVWHQMELALEAFPAVTHVAESFPCIELEPDAYDLQGYKPSLNLS